MRHRRVTDVYLPCQEDNQWEIDEAAGGASAEDQKKKLVAVGTGAVAMILSVAYLAGVLPCTLHPKPSFLTLNPRP